MNLQYPFQRGASQGGGVGAFAEVVADVEGGPSGRARGHGASVGVDLPKCGCVEWWNAGVWRWAGRRVGLVRVGVSGEEQVVPVLAFICSEEGAVDVRS